MISVKKELQQHPNWNNNTITILEMAKRASLPLFPLPLGLSTCLKWRGGLDLVRELRIQIHSMLAIENFTQTIKSNKDLRY